jgi:hypothetical protein
MFLPKIENSIIFEMVFSEIILTFKSSVFSQWDGLLIKLSIYFLVVTSFEDSFSNILGQNNEF